MLQHRTPPTLAERDDTDTSGGDVASIAKSKIEESISAAVQQAMSPVTDAIAKDAARMAGDRIAEVMGHVQDALGQRGEDKYAMSEEDRDRGYFGYDNRQTGDPDFEVPHTEPMQAPTGGGVTSRNALAAAITELNRDPHSRGRGEGHLVTGKHFARPIDPLRDQTRQYMMR